MKRIIVPKEREALYELLAGEKVLLSGTLYTIRDAACARMRELGDIPFDPKDQVIYYAAPTPKRPGEIIGSCGPTTSARMDPYTELFLSAGISGMVGKGPRAEYVVSLIKRFKAVYFVAIGGAACYLSQFIKDAEVIAYPDLLCEAVHKLFVEDLPLYVGIDFAGNSL